MSIKANVLARRSDSVLVHSHLPFRDSRPTKAGATLANPFSRSDHLEVVGWRNSTVGSNHHIRLQLGRVTGELRQR